MKNTTRFLCNLWFLGLVGCAAGQGERIARLPFRVAVLQPTIEGLVTEARATETRATGGEAREGTRFDLDAAPLAESIARRLAGTVFADGLVIRGTGSPRRGPQDASAKSEELSEEMEKSILAAREARASLILETRIRLAPRAPSSCNDRVWMNLMLYFFAGPASWFVRDRAYAVDLELFANLHMIEPILEGRAGLADGRARVASVRSSIADIDLSLIDRAGWSLLPYVASIVVPPSFLAKDAPSVRTSLQGAAVARLTSELCRRLAERAFQILAAGDITDIALAEGFELSRRDGHAHFSGEFLLRRRERTRLEEFVVQCGAEKLRGEFVESETVKKWGTGAAYLRYPLQFRIAVPDSATHVRVVVTSAGRDGSERSFCLPLEW